MAKTRVNWTIDKKQIIILKQAQKLNHRQTSLSELVEYAIRNTFQNKEDQIREKMRHHQIKLMEWKDKLKELQETK